MHATSGRPRKTRKSECFWEPSFVHQGYLYVDFRPWFDKIVFSHVVECASSRDYSVFYQVHEAARMTICHSALLRGILPPLLNRYTQHNNVHIWACEPAKLPYRLFNIYVDTHEYQV